MGKLGQRMARAPKKPESSDHITYRPEMNMQHITGFDTRLRSIPGSWTLTHSFLHAGDPRVVSLRWVIPDKHWCDEAGFLNFLDQRHHRMLLRCFLEPVEQAPSDDQAPVEEAAPVETDAESEVPTERQWRSDELLEQMGSSAKNHQLSQALQFLLIQEMVHEDQDTWSRGKQINPIATINATFEWVVQEYLQRFHHAFARRRVSFKEWDQNHLNDINVLAFTPEGLTVIVECKTDTDISGDELMHFIQRASAFPTDIALLLIDTEHEQHVTSQIQKLNAILGRKTSGAEEVHQYKGGTIAHLTGNLYVANTTGGIAASLEEALRMGTAAKGLVGSDTTV
jgi:hypothetical protein